jgi:DNA-binding MurR/RpiR family transcriptional regulator
MRQSSYKGFGYVLDEAVEEYLKENYSRKTNRELAETVGCGETTLGRFARELGLTKKQEKRKRI